MKYLIGLVSSLLVFSGCSQTYISTDSGMPNSSYSKKVSVYALENYTDTPQAGMRAANIIEGVLIARNYRVTNMIASKNLEMSLEDKIALAENEGSDYILIGGVSEWRYKTGIDGEPAVSLQLKLIDVKSKAVVWSATGSDNDWGNASIGTTAQSLIESMVHVDTDANKEQSPKAQNSSATQQHLKQRKAIASEKAAIERLHSDIKKIENMQNKSSNDYQNIVELYERIEVKEARISDLEASL